MQLIDCRNFRDLLDSYLSQELAVETNHAMLRHAEQCPPCRDEMGSRRRLRQTLRKACTRDEMSAEACERVRARLREESNLPGLTGEKTNPGGRIWNKFFAGLFSSRMSLPLAAAVASVLLISGSLGFFYWQRNAGDVGKGQNDLGARLTPALLDQAIGDHKNCATQFVTRSGPMEMPKKVGEYDPAYLGLEAVVSPGSAGLEFRSAHLCGYGGRKFAHLVYTLSSRPVSVLVTERDVIALGLEEIPQDDGKALGLQEFQRDRMAMGSLQTSKHIVLVVSELPEVENRELSAKLGIPVAEHLRNIERRHGKDEGGRMRDEGKKLRFQPSSIVLF